LPKVHRSFRDVRSERFASYFRSMDLRLHVE